MSQFDSPSEAALSQLKAEAQSSSPLDRAIGRIGATVAGLALSPSAPAFGALVSALKTAAGNKDEENLIYFAEAFVDDIRRLYRLSDEQRQHTEKLLSSDQFQESIANATLHIVRTNIKSRLKRLARVLSNSVCDGDLEPENIDDMMWCAVNLSEKDIRVLGIVYEMQHDLFTAENITGQRGVRTNGLQRIWQEWWRAHVQDYKGISGLEFQNSIARLEAAGLVAPLPKSFAESPVQNDMELLLFGLKFYERLREIASEDS